METQTETWKSPRAKEEERKALRMRVGSALADVILDGLMKPSEALKVYQGQFPEVKENK